jgi:tetratricopeptide (TPR) repeat protein
VANAIGNISNTYYFMDEYSKAVEYAQQHLEIAQEINDRHGEGTALLNLGNAYDALEEVNKAVEVYRQSLEIAQEIGAREGEGRALCNLGITVIQLEMHSEALAYLQAAINVVSETGERSTEAIILYSMAELYQKLGHQDMAQESCEKALAIATDLGLPDLEEYQELKEQLLRDIPQQ